ncbi:MAG TPA: PE-PPE domain-containing protein [Mycobacterium sp.]|nr:PE-PPE domain-containing protein [Mycobacterium sp.]
MSRLQAGFGMAIVGAGLVALPSAAPPVAGTQTHAIRLTSVDAADSPLGDGTAFIIGGSGLPTPGPAYAQIADSLYLAPHGFTGTTQVVTTPEELYPFLGPFGGTFDPSVAKGAQNVDAAIQSQIASGQVDAAHPAVVFGYSQGADVETSTMALLAKQGVPSDDVHFVMIGDPANPNGGMLERFDLPAGTQPTIPSIGLTMSGATPDDLYPTDIYTHEYDGFADFPQYPINFLADINALLGIAFEHTTYLGVTPAQIADAIQLPTSSADTMTDYYMLPAGLPLLEPLQLIPFIGNPLYDLLEPDMSVLVNLGYGDIADGWSQGDADVPTTLGFMPSSTVMDQVPQALANGLQQGITDFFKDLVSPSNYVYTLPAWAEELVQSAKVLPGSEFSVFSPVPTTLADLFDTFPPHTGLPPLDVASALLITLPEIGYHVFENEMADGNDADAIGIPIAAVLGILPLALVGAVI